MQPPGLEPGLLLLWPCLIEANYNIYIFLILELFSLNLAYHILSEYDNKYLTVMCVQYTYMYVHRNFFEGNIS